MSGDKSTDGRKCHSSSANAFGVQMVYYTLLPNSSSRLARSYEALDVLDVAVDALAACSSVRDVEGIAMTREEVELELSSEVE